LMSTRLIVVGVLLMVTMIRSDIEGLFDRYEVAGRFQDLL
jgi:hypothetical protein